MLRFEFREMIARPVEDVFDYASDPQHCLSSDPTAAVEGTPGALRTGSRFQVRFDDGRNRAAVEVIKYDPPNYYEFEANIDKPMPYVVIGKYSCTASECETEMYADLSIHDVPTVMEIIFRDKIREFLQGNLKSMRAALEARNDRVGA